MKIYHPIFYLLFALSLFSGCNKPSTSISLNEGWKFKTGDDAAFSKPGFDDSTWKNIKPEIMWEGQGYKDYDGIAWYRIKIIIPSSFKPVPDSQVPEGLELRLGKIDDNDICYMNGSEIGHTKGYNINRQYLIPPDKILWDKENVIAIRIEDTGGGGGLYEGPFELKKLMISDILTISGQKSICNIEGDKDTVLKSTLQFRFSHPARKIEGMLKIELENTFSREKKIIANEKISIGTEADSVYSFSIPVSRQGIYKVSSSFTAKGENNSCNSASLVAYKKIKHEDIKPTFALIAKKITDKASAFSYGEVKLHGYLEDRLEANLMNRLLKIDEQGILECFYNRPGKQEWVGEYAGKYLHAAARVWQYSRNSNLKTQMDRVTDILISCQDDDGYLGTYLPQNKWTSWDVWAHKYDMLGLLSYYGATGYKPALEASKKIGDLLCRTFGNKKGQLDIIKAGFHVGMAPCSVLEPMTDLYQFTGEPRYLDFCNYIIEAYETESGPKIISTLTTIGKVDKTGNGKAYEMTSNLIGIVKLYQITGEPKLLKAAEAAWTDISINKLYITGTASAGEMYRDDFVLPADNEAHMGEGCVTVTWIQFSQALYYLTGEVKYMDEIEKSIFNHLLAAENPTSGCVSYYTALIGKKPFRCTIDGNCCLASVPRGIAIIPELVYAKLQNGGLAINIYSAGNISAKIKNAEGKETDLKAEVETNFPASGIAKLKLMPATPGKFLLSLRVPAWCKNFVARFSGKEFKGEAGKYLDLNENWETTNIIDISFELNPHLLDGGKSYAAFQAIQVGPQILAFDQMLNTEITNPENISFTGLNLTSSDKNTELPKNWVGSEKFHLKAVYNKKSVSLILVPFADAGQTDGEVRVWIKKQ